MRDGREGLQARGGERMMEVSGPTHIVRLVSPASARRYRPRRAVGLLFSTAPERPTGRAPGGVM